MTTNEFDQDAAGAADLGKLEENLEKLEGLTKRLAKVMSHKRNVPASLQGPGQDLYMKAATAYMAEMMHNPAKMIEHQVGYWGKTLKHYVEAQNQIAHGKLEPPEDTGPSDPRFSNPLWDSHPFFNFMKQQYLLNAEAMQESLGGLEGLSERDRQRLDYFSRQIVDMLAPTNFLATNPDALEKAVETQGQSLVDGLENLVRDLEANQGELIVSLADKSAFKVGENIGTTPGQVVFRNRMLELIQYTPTTETVHEIPLVIFPPWINKFYILDLNAQKSLIKWLVDQGFTVFVTSWVNPDASYADVTLDTYVEEGYLAAIEAAKTICGTKKVNTVGYCIAGTTLSATLGVMKRRKDTSINSATFFTTMTDFSDPGEVGVFLADDFVDGLEAECAATGILDRFYMARTFSFLRSNDLIYKPAIKSYMMGETPPAFDLLFWNGDGTNLPGKMAVQYLRELCQGNQLAAGGFNVCGETVDLKDVTVPLCAVACETDHIAAWKSSYRGVQQMGSKDKTFILAGSGHIAGIVNPPAKKKYGHWTNPEIGLTAEDWRDSADAHEGSWWPKWQAWLAEKSGKQVPARAPGGPGFEPICPAPGTYVSAAPKL
ncbi:class I poly(R)-hydroxyalkanoic acid synthase [Loktanella sp. IMCC34160]|uniref:PHA/PHB synthase family protein n=1 Tax=Loktanella sp. IMCC34160 TaxID=2510646 RepID=UPI00101BEA51|nr:class I poly(R)-hydroxyalkanoic acid synthase [Loktanella sp. IMCC34160]RYG89324.1 class I poly(R)-hydroxyalkanoic acid synthase [Loktanella sp. IMCC34160]